MKREDFQIVHCRTGSVKIFIAGCPSLARQVCQRWVERGACVNVVNTDYIYKYGAERGVIVEFINYPRFPKPIDKMLEDAESLAFELAEQLSAGSFSIMADYHRGKGSQTTKFYSRRGDI